MIDLHAHMIPGLDDGAMDMEEAAEMAKMAYDSGVKVTAATSHADFSMYEPEEFWRMYKKRFRELQRELRIRKVPLKICTGAELMVNESFVRCAKDRRVISLNRGGGLLIEFHFDAHYRYALRQMEKLSEMGYRLVLAHPERYDFVKRDKERLLEIYSRGVTLQVNKGSILGEFGRRAESAADYMLRRGIAGAVASDAHDTALRTPDMRETARILDLYYGTDAAEVLLKKNPYKLLKIAKNG